MHDDKSGPNLELPHGSFLCTFGPFTDVVVEWPLDGGSSSIGSEHASTTIGPTHKRIHCVGVEERQTRWMWECRKKMFRWCGVIDSGAPIAPRD